MPHGLLFQIVRIVSALGSISGTLNTLKNRVYPWVLQGTLAPASPLDLPKSHKVFVLGSRQGSNADRTINKNFHVAMPLMSFSLMLNCSSLPYNGHGSWADEVQSIPCRTADAQRPLRCKTEQKKGFNPNAVCIPPCQNESGVRAKATEWVALTLGEESAKVLPGQKPGPSQKESRYLKRSERFELLPTTKFRRYEGHARKIFTTPQSKGSIQEGSQRCNYSSVPLHLQWMHTWHEWERPINISHEPPCTTMNSPWSSVPYFPKLSSPIN